VKSAQEIAPENESWRFLRNLDLVEIEHPDPYSFQKLYYMDRLKKVVAMVRKYRSRGLVLDAACAQGNFGLLLAEAGRQVVALDINVEFLRYSRAKHERGQVSWVCGSVVSFPFPDHLFEVILLGEVIEHVAYPEVLVAEALRLVKPDGIIIITTPNRQSKNLKGKSPSFSTIKNQNRRYLEAKQFGPTDEEHLFAFDRKELIALIKEANGKILRTEYAGSLIFNTHTYPFFRKLPIRLVELMGTLSLKVGIVRSLIGVNLIVCARPA